MYNITLEKNGAGMIGGSIILQKVSNSSLSDIKINNSSA